MVRDHIRILGILNIVMGGLTAFAGVVVLIVMGGLAGFLAADSSDSREAAPWMGLLGMAICAFLVALALPAIIGGWGLLKYKSWSRVLMIVVSALSLLHIPLGTALGVYGLWVLTNDQTRQLLDSGGAYPPPAFTMPQQPMQYGPPPSRPL